MHRNQILALAGLLAATSGSSFAQYSSSAVAYNFTDIAATGTSLGLAGIEDGGASLPIGFSFEFYDVPITTIAATTNGYLTTGTNLTEWIPDCPLPDTVAPNGVIAPYFDDLSLTNTGEIFYETLGTAPDRVTIVQWENSGAFMSSFASATFQVQLFENGNRIQYHYETLSDTSGAFPILGDNAFVGLESQDGQSAEVIHCIDGMPIFTPGVTAYQLEAVLPFLSTPTEVVSNTPFTIPGEADPGTFYIFAWARNAGPIGPIPFLENVVLDLAINFKFAGVGLTPADGEIASDTLVPPAGLDGTVIFWQIVTVNSFGPIMGVKKSNSDTTTLRDGARFTGSLPVVGVADSYAIPATAGDVIDIFHCRVDNTGGGGSTLDPYVCLVDPTGVIEASDDDSGGDCLVVGPGGASEIVNHTLLMSGTYLVYASSVQGIPGTMTGDYELTILGPGATGTVPFMDDGPICPGQPFTNPAGKLEVLDPLRRR